MAKARVALGLLAGCLLAGGIASAQTGPSAAQVLQFKPRQPGVVCTTPTPEEQKACKVELKQGTRPGSSGWLLVDGKGQPVRRFFDTNGDKKIDIWSYFKDGVEIYREIDTNNNEKPDQYRWLNAGGMKWGIDGNEDGKIDSWRVISADEAAHEAYLAVATRDLNRLKALLVADADLQALKLPKEEADRIRKQLTEAPAKFNKTVQKLANLNDKAQFVRVEGAVPQCVPADALGSDQDAITYPDRAVLYQTADGKHEWLHTGGMVQVGATWRLTGAPSAEDEAQPATVADGSSGKAATTDDPILKGFYEKLGALDSRTPPMSAPGVNPEVARFYQERASVIEQILGKMKDAKDVEMWQKQLADNLSTWAQYSKVEDTAGVQRLSQLRGQVEKAAPGSNLAAYVTFRELWARFGGALSQTATPQKMEETQKAWMEALSKFVQQYPRAEDAADALSHLAMNAEFSGKEDEAKRWYQQIYTGFPQHALAEKAKGAARRLELVGRPMELAGPTLQGKPFNLTTLRNKVVVVYYWASFSPVCVGDFARLRVLQQTYASKGLEIVTVGLDDRAEDATRFVQNHGLNATHLFQATEQNQGLNSPLALQYGINSLPSLILIGKDGNVISRTMQINDLEDAIKKAL